MAKKGLSDEELERLINEMSSDSEEEDFVEQNEEENEESGDSLSDPEWKLEGPEEVI